MSRMKRVRLYNYLPISSRSLGIIATGKIWYAKPKSFNDPFDCGMDLCDNLTIEEKIQVLHVKMKRQGWTEKMITEQLLHSLKTNGNLNDTAAKIIQKLTDLIHQNRDNIGILSLSRTCKSVLMWSHYAAEHCGMCIEFTVSVSNSLHKIDYATDVPQNTLHDIYVKRDSKIISLLTTKQKHWLYEKEYRLVVGRGDILNDIPGPITSIIFGLRTLQSDELLTRKIASDLDGIRYKKCVREAGKFSVKIEDI